MSAHPITDALILQSITQSAAFVLQKSRERIISEVHRKLITRAVPKNRIARVYDLMQ
jgi:hypothetical protein